VPGKTTPYKSPQVEFLLSAPDLDHCPDLQGKPEIAMIGRSNVGKSSFINKLTKRKKLAHTSNTPGKTRLINYYVVADSWALVDLPGYGFAKVSKTEQARWRQNLEEYLLERESLLGVIQLIDSRHGAQPNDIAMNGWLNSAGIEVAVVLTKTDKAKKAQTGKMAASVRKDLKFSRGLYLFSAETGDGAEAVWWGLKEWRENPAEREVAAAVSGDFTTPD
jgi:GTP-binding protein